MEHRDLIVAVATPPGQGGIGVVRISGKEAHTVGAKLAGRDLPHRMACYVTLMHEGQALDEGLAIAFGSPRSFTGEDVVELHCHGSPVVLQSVLDAACQLGARLARPGEFSERAFLNDKMDLAQAEAVADLISSASVLSARAALRSMQGVFSERVTSLGHDLEQTRILLEASIDFPEEEEDFLAAYDIPGKVDQLTKSLNDLLAQSQQGQRFRDGCSVALIGAPNAGKSSLLNALTGEDAAIVTDIPGTTRDLLKVDMVIDGLPVKLVDTAGLRLTDDVVERKGVERAVAQTEQADVILLVLDLASTEALDVQQQNALRLVGIELLDDRIVTIVNKCDLQGGVEVIADELAGRTDAFKNAVALSALTGEGMTTLKRRVSASAGVGTEEVIFTARARHIEALKLVQGHLAEASQALVEGTTGEIIAEELRAAHLNLGEILGQVTADELLGKIFSQFCIGK
ncbi:MAG: tRNA modification GTPase [Limisphaerales bacterium]|jgi:tRNA modification GTPase